MKILSHPLDQVFAHTNFCNVTPERVSRRIHSQIGRLGGLASMITTLAGSILATLAGKLK